MDSEKHSESECQKDAIRQLRPILSDVLQHHIDEVLSWANTFNIVSDTFHKTHTDSNDRKRTESFISLIRDRIESDPQTFGKFLQIFRRISSLSYLADSVIEELCNDHKPSIIISGDAPCSSGDIQVSTSASESTSESEDLLLHGEQMSCVESLTESRKGLKRSNSSTATSKNKRSKTDHHDHCEDVIGYSNAIGYSNGEHWAETIHLCVSHGVQRNKDLRAKNDECQRKIEELKIDLQNVTNKKIELQIQLKEIENQKNEQERISIKEQQELKERIKEMQKREHELTDALAAKSGEYKSLEQQLKQTREFDEQELNGLQSQVQEQKDMLQQERKAREEREHELTKELSAKSINNQRLQWELEQMESQAQENKELLRQEREARMKEEEKLQSEVQNMTEANRRLQDDVHTKDETIRQLREKIVLQERSAAQRNFCFIL